MEGYVNFVVCGKFHYGRYLKYLHEFGILKRMYYSHRISSTLDIPESVRCNKYLKEYMMYFHLKVLGDKLFTQLLPGYHRVWERGVLRDFVGGAVNHFLAHGNSLEIMRMVRGNGQIIIAEAVNAHPKVQSTLLREEYAARGMKYQENPIVLDKQLEEFDLADNVLVASRVVQRSFIAEGFDKKKIIRIPYGVNISISDVSASRRPAKDGVSEAKVRLVCVGQIVPRKGQFYLLSAVRLLRKQAPSLRIEITLVGRPDQVYLKCLRELDVEFSHIPFVQNTKMVEFLKSFDVFVLPSIEDGFSVAVLEAIEAGLPVITTNSNGGADAVEDASAGVVIPPSDANALAEAIISVVEDPPQAQRAAILTWQDYARMLSETYAELLENQCRGD
jgi:glycosyltransferase involved in cell wall biosynthesis